MLENLLTETAEVVLRQEEFDPFALAGVALRPVPLAGEAIRTAVLAVDAVPVEILSRHALT